MRFFEVTRKETGMKQKSIKKNMVMSILLTSSNFIFPVITYSYVARVLGPGGTGNVAFVYSVLSYFSYIAILGIPTYGLREVAKVRDDKEKMSHLVQELLTLNLFSTVIAYILLIGAVLLVPRLFDDRMLFLVMGGYIFLNTIGLEWVYQALEEYSYITIRSLFFKTVALVLTFVLIRTKEDVLWYGFLHIFTNSASYVLNFLHIRKYISFKKSEGYNFKRHLHPILTLFAASIIITIYANFDVTMIGFISTEDEVGLYNAALKIKSLVLSLSTAVTAVLVPRMAYYLKDGDKAKANGLIQKSLRVSLCLAIPVATYIFIFGADCISLLCGNEYLGAVPTLRILILCILPLVLTNLFGNQILIPSGNEKRYSQSVFVGMWINLVLNALMIPTMGAFGAAIGTLVTECWNVFWMSGGAKDYRSMLLRTVKYFVYLIPLIVASAVSIFISNAISVAVFWRLVITAITFFGLFYGILYFEKEPLLTEQVKLMQRKIRRNKS